MKYIKTTQSSNRKYLYSMFSSKTDEFLFQDDPEAKSGHWSQKSLSERKPSSGWRKQGWKNQKVKNWNWKKKLILTSYDV